MASSTPVDAPTSKRKKWVAVAKNLCQRSDGKKWCALVSVEGKAQWGPSRATLAEAEADKEALKAQQRDGAVQRRQEQADKEQAVRDANADHLAANQAIHGGNNDMDRLSRDFVMLALLGTDVVGVPGVEYSKDMHLFRRADDLGFDPDLDIEPDDAVPTLVAELKSTSQKKEHNGTMTNPKVQFQGLFYSKDKATIVVMFYIPDDIKTATVETLARVKFWWEIALGWAPKNGEYKRSLNGGSDPNSRPIPGHRLGEVLRRQVHRRVGEPNGLLPYGERKRVFKNAKHAKGQAVIDAIEMQVLLPMDARLLPPAGGGEGGAADCRIAFADGTTPNAQAKAARLDKRGHNSGFYVGLNRHDGSIVNADGSTSELFKPYTKGENAWYLFGVLDADGVGIAEYWAPTEADLLGEHVSERLITDADGNRGVTSLFVHPKVEDKARLGDLVPNGANQANDRTERTRRWLRKLGPILPLAEAQALKALADTARRAERLAAKAARAAQEAQASTTPTTPTTATPSSDKRAAPLALDTNPKRVEQRKNGDLSGWFSKRE